MSRRRSKFFVCGVDPGSKIATLCFADVTGRADPIFCRAVGENAVQTAQQVFQVAEVNFLHLDPIVVWIEEPRGYNSRAIHQLSVVAGAVAAAAKGYPVDFVSAGEWKKLIGLPGNAKKAVIREWAHQELPHARRLDEHMADAYGIARAIISYGEDRDDPRGEAGAEGQAVGVAGRGAGTGRGAAAAPGGGG